MKPNIKNTLYRHDDVTETIGMRIDTDSLSHLMTVLTDLYSNPIAAIVREISTNARDSHIDAGVDRPIEIALPTEGHRKFVVRDFGIGLSVDDIRNVFSAYGASTKRESNSVTGMLGLGCKAPLSYTNSFTVEAVKDGVKAIANVTKDESNVGSIKILDTFETDEANGVTVSVPVRPHDAGRFRSEAEELFSYWRGGVLVDGEEPAGVDESDHFFIDPDVALMRYERTIVMGGVPYKVPHSSQVRNGWVAWVDMGEVDFTPSREALHMTKRTEETVKAIEGFVAERFAKVVNDELAQQPNDWERLKKYRQIQQSSFRSFQGLAQFRDLSMPDDSEAWHCRIEGDGQGTSWKARSISIYNLIDIIGRDVKIVTGFPFKRVSPLHKAMLAQLHKGQRVEWLILPEGLSLLGYQDMPHTKWETIPEIPKATRPKVVRSAKNAPKYDIWHQGNVTYDKTVKDLVPDDKILAGVEQQHVARSFSLMLPDVYIVYLPSTRVDKFFRLYDDALHAKDLNKLVEKHMSTISKKLTKNELMRLAMDNDQIRTLQEYADELNDPIFDVLVRAVKCDMTRIHKLNKLVQEAPYDASQYKCLPPSMRRESVAEPNEWTKAQERYPLIFGGNRNNYYWRQQAPKEALIEYANDRYELHYKGA